MFKSSQKGWKVINVSSHKSFFVDYCWDHSTSLTAWLAHCSNSGSSGCFNLRENGMNIKPPDPPGNSLDPISSGEINKSPSGQENHANPLVPSALGAQKPSRLPQMQRRWSHNIQHATSIYHQQAPMGKIDVFWTKPGFKKHNLFL